MINVYSDLQMKSASLKLHHWTGFPTNPTDGEIAVVDGAMFAYTQLEGKMQWVPMTNKREYYTHSQSTASDTWIVTHNLGTTDFIYAVYDENNMIQMATATVLTLDSIQINLIGSMTGKVVVMGASDKFAGYQVQQDVDNLVDTISYGTIEPTGEEDTTLYFQVGV